MNIKIIRLLLLPPPSVYIIRYARTVGGYYVVRPLKMLIPVARKTIAARWLNSVRYKPGPDSAFTVFHDNYANN